MKVSLLFSRRMLLVCAVLCVAAALVVAFGVIHPVQADTFPGATPAAAVLAFRVNIGLNLLAAVILVVIAIWSKGRSRISTAVLVVLGLFVLFFGLALLDAAFAYHSEGAAMQTASTLLFFCTAADGLAGALAITTAFLRPRKT